MWYFENNMELSLEIIKKLTTKEYLKNRREIRLFLKPIYENRLKEEKSQIKLARLKVRLELLQQKEDKEKKNQKYRKLYYLNNKARILKFKKEQRISKKRLKREKTLKNRILNNLRSRLSHALKRNSKSSHTLDYIGCSLSKLKIYLENQFIEGMSWENYGKWHIDHIRPCVSFDLSSIEEQHKCFHYSNLQPLWEKDNLSKNDKYKNP